jgi:hypothetical protein
MGAVVRGGGGGGVAATDHHGNCGALPIVTIVVIFSTANHYLLDAAVGVAVATFALYGGLPPPAEEGRTRPAKDHKVTNKTTIHDESGDSI